MIQRLRHNGNRRTKGCQPDLLLGQKEILDLASQGIAAAKDYCTFQGWGMEGGPKSSFDMQTAEKLHALAVIETAMPFSGAAHPRWVELFKIASQGQYPGISRKVVAKQLKVLFGEVEEHLEKVFNTAMYVGTLTTDGATSQGFNMVNWWYDSQGAGCHIKTQDCGWSKQDAQWLSEEAASHVRRIGVSKVAIITDRASVMRKARRLLKAQIGFRDLFWGWCGEHVGNNLAEKIRVVFPWVRESVKTLRKLTVYQSRKNNFGLTCMTSSGSRVCRGS